ncbi:MAG: ATP-dependent helicase [Eubacteriales bacterium]
MNSILSGLNPDQIAAVEATEGYVRVVAGAGTGKTKALTHRYAYLVQELGVSTSNILCMTFTNKAANEMKNRVRSMLGEGVDCTLISTIHSFCARILREDIEKLFYPSSFLILDNADQKQILEEVYEELGLKLDTASFQTMLDRIERYKIDLTYVDWLSDPTFDILTLRPDDTNEAIIMRYLAKQKKNFALDFADLIKFVTYLFNHFPDVEEKWQKKLSYIQVDEYQDVDIEQYTMINRLAAYHHNLFVVGDPDQNIYEWRGAGMRFLLNFDKENTPCRTIFMNQNYRSTPEILAVSNCLIAKNQIRIKKDLFTANPGGPLPEYYHGGDEKEEIGRIVSYIGERHAEGTPYRKIAILYRSSYVSRFIEQGLLEAGIPYTVYGGVGFYERAEIKSVIAYMRMVAFGDDLSFIRVVNLPRRKIGKLKTDALKSYAAEGKCSLYQAMKHHLDDPIFKGSGAKAFVELIERMRELAADLSVSELLQRLFHDSGYEAYIRKCGDMDRLDNVNELLNSIYASEVSFGEDLTLSTYLESVSLFREKEDEKSEDRLRLMTVHTAKGLEFDHVVVAGMSDRIFPSPRAIEERKREALEEERRLAFVAFTRAKKSLLFTDSEGIGVKGILKQPSRFLVNDLDPKLISITGRPFLPPSPSKGDGTAPVPVLFAAGDRVVHRIFGVGTVQSVDEKGRSYLIRFPVGDRPISFDFKGLVKV